MQKVYTSFLSPSFLSIHFSLALVFFACQRPSSDHNTHSDLFLSIIQADSSTQPVIPLVDGFDFPVGPPNAKSYYNANPFGTNLHLGDDWNGVGGGNTDLGDPVYSLAHGFIVEARDHGAGWGKVIRIIHRMDSADSKGSHESLYAHLDTMLVASGDIVTRGQQVGTIGTADGAYLAHLHLEIRTIIGLPLGGGYASDTSGYTNPSAFIHANRPTSPRD